MNRVNPKAPPPRQSRQETHMQGDTYSNFEDIQETDVQRTKLIIEAKVSRMDAMWTTNCHHHATFPGCRLIYAGPLQMERDSVPTTIQVILHLGCSMADG